MILKKYFKIAMMMSLFLVWPVVYARDKQVIGWVEEVYIGYANIRLIAKVDTGADYSSIKAEIEKKFHRNGEEWVRFRVKDRHGHAVEVERKIVRYARIKRRMAPSIKRPVVMLGVCMDSVYREVEVNLAKRKRFKYHMLIGRNFLRGHFLVDAELKNTRQPACAGIKGD